MEKNTRQTVLLAGGAGYIGSHTAVELLSQNYNIVIADAHYNSTPSVYERLRQITGIEIPHYEIDVCNEKDLECIFKENHIDVIIDFAGYKSVAESVQKPYQYYRNNLDTTFSLLYMMEKYNVTRLIFSSSATVYGMNNSSPMLETMKPGECTNPYGWTKYMNEQILKDVSEAGKKLSIVLLRYFNPVGAHESGLLGEDPKDIPNNLMPYISQVASGKLQMLNIFGDDYNTPDGTGVRDYIHVVDLAKAHVQAAAYTEQHQGIEIFNIGTGIGYSVLDMVHAFERVNHVPVPYTIVERRPGDIAACYADSHKAERILGWKAEKNLEDMCRDTWNWQKNQSNM